MATRAAKISCALGFVLLSAALAAGGCGSSVVSSICAARCDCKPCMIDERNACEESSAAAQQKAQSLDCTTALDAYTNCLDGSVQWESGSATDNCAKEEAALVTCTKGIAPFKDVCELATDHLIACGVMGKPTTGGPQPVCAGSLACNATCINTQNCPV